MVLSRVVRAGVDVCAIVTRASLVALAALALVSCGTRKLPDKIHNGGSFENSGFSGTQQDFNTNVGSRILFDTDSANLTVVARGVLDGQAKWLVKYPNHPVTVEGHADERGTREYNLALGARRAAATRDYLVARGVGRNRIHTISYGKERPVAVCDNVSCWSQNRRAVTALSTPAR